MRSKTLVAISIAIVLIGTSLSAIALSYAGQTLMPTIAPGQIEKDPTLLNEIAMFLEGMQTFRYETFGDEAFWGDALQVHKAIEGATIGGVGPGVNPATALAVGLKVDVNALPQNL